MENIKDAANLFDKLTSDDKNYILGYMDACINNYSNQADKRDAKNQEKPR